jgi:hypothetical protein
VEEVEEPVVETNAAETKETPPEVAGTGVKEESKEQSEASVTESEESKTSTVVEMEIGTDKGMKLPDQSRIASLPIPKGSRRNIAAKTVAAAKQGGDEDNTDDVAEANRKNLKGSLLLGRSRGCKNAAKSKEGVPVTVTLTAGGGGEGSNMNSRRRGTSSLFADDTLFKAQREQKSRSATPKSPPRFSESSYESPSGPRPTKKQKTTAGNGSEVGGGAGGPLFPAAEGGDDYGGENNDDIIQEQLDPEHQFQSIDQLKAVLSEEQFNTQYGGRIGAIESEGFVVTHAYSPGENEALLSALVFVQHCNIVLVESGEYGSDVKFSLFAAIGTTRYDYNPQVEFNLPVSPVELLEEVNRWVQNMDNCMSITGPDNISILEIFRRGCLASTTTNKSTQKTFSTSQIGKYNTDRGNEYFHGLVQGVLKKYCANGGNEKNEFMTEVFLHIIVHMYHVRIKQYDIEGTCRHVYQKGSGADVKQDVYIVGSDGLIFKGFMQTKWLDVNVLLENEVQCEDKEKRKSSRVASKVKLTKPTFNLRVYL